MSLLSVDVLHQVFKFFVSSDQIVDGESIRVAGLVCKQWRDIVDSRSLWATPAGIKEREGDREYDGDNDGDHGCRFCRVHQSLRIREEVRSLSSSETSLRSSLIGFVNLKQWGLASDGGVPELYFFVRERATRSTFLLSLSRDGKISPSILRDLYVHHFESKEDFLRNDRNHQTGIIFPPQRFPSGISIWNGRVLRWYRCDNETEAVSIMEEISCKQKQKLNQKRWLAESDNKISLVGHLMDLEKASLGDRDSESYHYEGRKHIMDWIVEIVECFDLEDRTIFQAMLLFDRFIASPGERVKTSRFQLVAGACVSIASKRNEVFLTEKDISFCCDNIFSVANITATEKLVLNRLGWKLACPSSNEFLNMFLMIADIEKDSRTQYLCFYVSELSLAFDTSYRYPPSLIAASAMVLARYALRDDGGVASLWPDALAHATGLQLGDLVGCSVRLSNDAETIRLHTSSSRLDMIYRRYSKPCRRSVAELTIPVLASTAILTTSEARLRSQSPSAGI